MNDCTPVKRCTKCGNEYPNTREYFKWNRRNGVRQPCKACAVAYSKEWAIKNPEKVKSNQANYVRQYPDRVRHSKRSYASAHPELVRASARRSHQKGREKKRERARAYYAEHPEKAKIYVLRRRALRQTPPSSFTSAEWSNCLEYWHERCAVCGRPPGLWHTLAADHWIPLSSPNCPGNVATNIIPLCHGVGGCNNSKIGKPPAEWLTQKSGKRKAKAKLAEIEQYFRSLLSTGNTDP